MDNKYNGWANYATWRIQLEIVDDYVHMLTNEIAEGQYDDWDWSDVADVADTIRNYVDEVITQDIPNDSLALSYAYAFLSDVDWYELATHAQEYWEENAKQFTACDNCEAPLEIIEGSAPGYCNDCEKLMEVKL